MDLLDDPIFQGQSGEAAPDESAGAKGLRSGLTSLRGQGHAVAANVGEAVGANDFAREHYARSKELQAQAAEEAPTTRFGDVHDLKSGFDYVTGTLGQAAPLAAGALAAGLITKRPILGPTAAMAVPEAGDIIERQQNDPASLAVSPQRRLANAAAGGTASAAVMSAVPGSMAEKIAGRTAATAAKTVPGVIAKGAETAAVGGVTGAGGEALKQAALHQSNQELPYDSEAVKEAGIGGAVVGGALGVPGAAVEAAHGASTNAKEAVAGALAKSTERVKEGYSGLFNKEGTKDDAMARAISQDKPVEPVPPGADPAAHVAQSDAKATEWVTSKLKGWLDDATLDDETKAKAADLLAKVSDPLARKEVAIMDLTRKATERAGAFYDHVAGDDGSDLRAKVNGAVDAVKEHLAAFASKSPGERAREMRDSISSLMKDGDLTDQAKAHVEAAANNIGDRAQQVWVATAKKAAEFKDQLQKGIDIGIPGAEGLFKSTKQSEDYSGVRAVISKEIVPAIQKNAPEVLSNPRSIQLVADGIRTFVQQVEAGKRPEQNTLTMGYLRTFLGADTIPVLERVALAINSDAKSRERMYAALNDMHDHFTTEDSLHDLVKSSAVDKVSPTDVKEAVKSLKSYASGAFHEGKTQAQRMLDEKRIRAEIDKAFGAKANSVLEAFGKAHDESKAKVEMDATRGKEGDPGEGSGDAAKSGVAEHSLEETDLQYEPPRIYGSKDKGFILSHEAHAREYGNQDSQAKKLLERAKKDNPDRNVSFVKARDIAKERGITDEDLHTMTGGKPDDFGVVAAEGQRQEGRITEEQARNMLLDTKEHANSKSRVNTEKDGVTLDAYKITQQTLKDMPYIEGESNARRTARAFFEGLGSALIHFDTTVKGALPDSLVVAVRNGVKITYGDIAQYKGKGEYSITAKFDLESEAKDLKRLIAKTDDPAKREALVSDLEDVNRKLFNREKNDGKNAETPTEQLKREMGVYDFSPEDEIHLAALEHEKTGAMERRPEDANRQHDAARDERAPKQAKLPREEAPITAKEPTEHVAERKHTFADDAKDIIEGGSASEAAIKTALKMNDARHLQRLIKAVNDTKIKSNRERLNANDAIERLNRAMGETLKKSPDAAYDLQLKRSAQATDEAFSASDKSREHVEKYIKDVLGGKVSIEWAKIMHAGEFAHTKGEGKIDPTYAIRLSVHALDPQGAAYHESLHAFFQMLREQGNHDVMKVLYRAADTAPVMNQLRRLLKDEPEALKQIEANREERVAYMYQFYAKQKLTVGAETKTVFGKIKDFIYRTLGMWTNDERATHIMDWFHEGEFAKNIGDRNAVSRALMEPGRNKAVEWVKAAAEPLKKLEQAVIGTGAERMRNTANPALIKIADLIQPQYAAQTHDVGFLQSAMNEHKSRLNDWVRGLKGLSEDEIFAAHEAMRRGEKGSSEREQQAIDATRKLLDKTFDYMQAAGVRVRDLGYGKDYFPRIWDSEYISKNQDAFRQMLAKYETQGKFKGNVERVLSNLMARDGSELGVVVDMPGMQHTKERVLNFISPEDAAPFLQKNMFQTINSYVMQATRRAEWAKRFGDDGKGMRSLLDEAQKEHGATQEEINMAQDFIRGIDGTLGDDINPTARRLMGNMIVYQNIRLLPLAIFSSLIDAGGIKVRGGTLSDSWAAFKRGAMEIPRGFKKNVEADEAYRLAQDIGAIDDTALVHALGSSYTQGMVAEGARKWNDAFFKFNLMEQYNMSMRVSATEAAARFVARHAGDVSKHSERWLAELGLTKGDVIVKDGRPLIRQTEFEAHGIKPDDAAAASNKMRGALNRWVDGAILRPNAADKPIWMNDPHYALIAHLKQFTYAFQNTILKRVWHEAQHENYAPAIALASYVPTMMAADFVKGLIQGGGTQPDWKKGWDIDDYVWSGVQRAGLLGVSQYSTDIMKDVRQGGAGIGAIMGPTYEQFSEGIKTLGGNEMFKTFATHSMPANALYSHAFHASATDPNFSE